MKYFNAVLKPPSGLDQQFIDFAQENFADKADGYCLSDKVLPHIKLCLFKADDLLDIYIDTISKVPEFVQYNVGIGREIHKGYVWAEIIIKPKAWLLHLHEYVKNKLNASGAEILTKHYTPHITFCRLPESQKEFADSIEIPNIFFKPHDGWTFEIGHSDVNGQYFGE